VTLPDRRSGCARASHANAPLSPEGGRRLVERCQTRPIAHVAAEMGMFRATASKWVNRFRDYGHPRADRPFLGPEQSADRHPGRDRRANRTVAARAQVVSDPDRPPAIRRRTHRFAPHRQSASGRPRTEPSPSRRSERGDQPPTNKDHRAQTRTHGAPRREESWSHPPRAEAGEPTDVEALKLRPSTAQGDDRTRRIHVSALGDRRLFPPRFTPKHCQTRRPRPQSLFFTERGHGSVLTGSPGSNGLSQIMAPATAPTPSRDHSSVHAPKDHSVHAATKGKSGALQPNPRRATALRAKLALRSAAPTSARRLEYPLQLPPTTQRRGRTTASGRA
jgi:hypothetical protein